MIDIDNLNLVIKSLLSSIGIESKADIFDFFYQDIYSLSNPFEINAINVFISRLSAAINSGESILIYGDKDADGVTAASIMYNTLKVVSKNVYAFVPNRETGYGLSKEVIEKYAASGVTLIITVDCGISNISEVEFARELGVDIIVSDHHDVPDALPNAYAIYNPKIKNSGFSSTNYSGCAVAFKLMQAFVFSYTKFYNKDAIILDYQIDKSTNTLNYVKALRVKNFIADVDIFAFEKRDSAYFMMYDNEYNEALSEADVLEELASYMFVEEHVVLVLNGGNERLKRLNALYEKYEIFIPAYEDVFNLLELARHYGNINLKFTKTLKEFALALKVNIYRYEGFAYGDMLIRAAIFERLFYMSQEKLITYMKRESILAALGTVADIIPLTGESRVYVRSGLLALASTTHIRYKAILNKIKIVQNGRVDTKSVAWRFAPFINAAGRMGKPEIALSLLTSEDEADAIKLTEAVFDMNEARKALTDENFSALLSQIKDEKLYLEPIIVVKSDIVDQGLTGLIANRIVSEYNKPAIVLCENLDTGICVGSARSNGTDNVRNMLDSLSSCLIKYGGHRNAAGFSIDSCNFVEFRKSVQLHAQNNTFGADSDTKPYNLRIVFYDITLELAEYLEMFEPYGCGNEEPTFASYNISISSIKRIGKNNTHLMMSLTSEGKTFTAMLWNVDEEKYLTMEKYLAIEKVACINIIYKIRVSRYNGSSGVRLYIEDYDLIYA